MVTRHASKRSDSAATPERTDDSSHQRHHSIPTNPKFSNSNINTNHRWLSHRLPRRNCTHNAVMPREIQPIQVYRRCLKLDLGLQVGTRLKGHQDGTPAQSIQAVIFFCFCSPLAAPRQIIFVVNEIIGRDFIKAVDAGDTIFVHLFGAYFGLTVSRVLYNPAHDESGKQGASYTSDMFSMVGTVFLWMFWPR